MTGHSLGGALAPLLSLFLSDTQQAWQPAKNTKIACLASAGPTPGNSDFASYFISQLGPSTTRFWNSLDVVPHVWNAVEIAAIPSLYAPDIPSDPLVQALAENARVMSLLGDYTHITQVAGQPGTLNKSQTVLDTADGNFVKYIKQLKYQHVDAYADLFKVPKLGTVIKGFCDVSRPPDGRMRGWRPSGLPCNADFSWGGTLGLKHATCQRNARSLTLTHGLIAWRIREPGEYCTIVATAVLDRCRICYASHEGRVRTPSRLCLSSSPKGYRCKS